MKKKDRKYPNGRYMMLPPEVMASELYQALPGKTMWVLQRFYQKAKWRERKRRTAKLRLSDILNNGEIIFSYAEAAENNVSASTMLRSLERLVEFGFLDIAEAGNPMVQTFTKYAISDRFKNYGTPDFKAVKKTRTLPPGQGFQPGNKYGPKAEK